MTQEHPITPSEDQIMLWCKQWNCTKEPGPIHKWLAIQAARWGADQELEACCEWLRSKDILEPAIDALRTTLRPKPPSLKEQALALINHDPENQPFLSEKGIAIIRHALESLPD